MAIGKKIIIKNLKLTKYKENDWQLYNYRLGFTLIELMIAILVGAIVTSAMLVFFITSTRTYMVQDELVMMNQNLRNAMQAIGGDVRAAGAGYDFFGSKNKRIDVVYNPPGTLNFKGITSIFSQGNGTTAVLASDGKMGLPAIDGLGNLTKSHSSEVLPGTDAISLFGLQPHAAFAVAYTDEYNGARVTGTAFDIKQAQRVEIGIGDAFVVAGPPRPRLFLAISISGAETLLDFKYEIDTGNASNTEAGQTYNGSNYTDGGPYGKNSGYFLYPVGNFYWNHYYVNDSVDNKPSLMLLSRNKTQINQEEVVIAENIEDLQFRYHTDYIDDSTDPYDYEDMLTPNGSISTNFDFDTETVKAVEIAIIARTGQPGPPGAAGRFTPIKVFDHTPASTKPDGYRRSSLHSIIAVRNAR